MRFLPRITLLTFLVAFPLTAAAQGMPTSQPGVLSIFVEEIKVGMDADHEAVEAGWPAAYAKAKSPYYYLALESMTGVGSEVWFVAPYASWAAEEASMKEAETNPALGAELKRLRKADGPHLAGYRSIQAIARPELGAGQFPDLALVRFYEISTFRIRPGHEQAFEAAAKVYADITKAGAPGMSYRMYQVTSGMPGGTYLVFGSTGSYADFDKQMADGQKMWEKVSAADMATLQKTMRDDVMSTITNRYRVSPTMSYVSPEAKAKAAAFWK